MGLAGNQVVLVSDSGCNGLFDSFFDTHSVHGLHGRALTYATGLKMARPDLKVVVTLGDGGLGIGGAHFLGACRRNLDITLLVLNNFNFGMTGGQFSVTTPPEARVGSGFLNRLEKPLDACGVAVSAGAAFVTRCSSFSKNLASEIENAIRFEGFSFLDIWGICTGRYTRWNKSTPQMIEESLARLGTMQGIVPGNARKEYGQHYRELAAIEEPTPPPVQIVAVHRAPATGRQAVMILGSAGQRILTAGEILCTAGLTAGLHVAQKSEYDITVLRGLSVSEVILSPEEINYTGIERPGVVLAVSQEGVARRKAVFDRLDDNAVVIRADSVDIPQCRAKVHTVDFKGQHIGSADWSLASLAVLASLDKVISTEMLRSALECTFEGKNLGSVMNVVDRVNNARRLG
jgi:pyruvate/2-oxoacid:ferredoxin oxidoreductase beta subunit/Pyruvate/2-oxoacid:ferredoxin oxidoreductase gamma subunit